uniref:NADH dehydrogenase [ubiquinone] 1 alpha subcomplex assembly factor 3 n=1 Tax=Glossina brevipalpis TaxID=37001 RepID=A0A1A9WW31_9MUSC
MAFIHRLGKSVYLTSLVSIRNINTSGVWRHSKAYDCDGKTKVNIFNTQQELGVMITGYSQYGFRLNNDMVVIGPIAVFPKSVLSWNVNNLNDINEESLSLFTALEPKLDVLIVGTGDQEMTPNFSKRILHFMRTHKINTEVLRTEQVRLYVNSYEVFKLIAHCLQACATFNFLNAENRMVGAALIPPVHVAYNENDLLVSNKNTLKYLTFENDEK